MKRECLGIFPFCWCSRRQSPYYIRKIICRQHVDCMRWRYACVSPDEWGICTEKPTEKQYKYVRCVCPCVGGVHPPRHASVCTRYTSKAGRRPAAVPVVSAVNLTIVLSKDECVHAAKTKHIEEVPGGWTHPETRMPNIQLKTHLFCLDFNYFVYVLYIFVCLFFSACLCKLSRLFILSLLLNQPYTAWQPAYI